MGKVFKVDGAMAKHILAINGYWYYYDQGYHHMTLYIRGTKEFPVHQGINPDGQTWWLCDSHYGSLEEKLVEHGIYEFKIEHHDYDYITKAYDALMKKVAERRC